MTSMEVDKQNAQLKLVNKLLQTCSEATSSTAVEVLGALELVKVKIANSMIPPPPEATTSLLTPPMGILKPRQN